jgi:hypothetical protein
MSVNIQIEIHCTRHTGVVIDKTEHLYLQNHC